MTSIEALTNKLTYAKRQKAFAWAKYYESVGHGLTAAHASHSAYVRVAEEPSIPAHIKAEMTEMATALHKQWECPICKDMITAGELEITNCGHFYCKPCLEGHKAYQHSQAKPKWECAVCRRKHGYGAE
jgi:hypothetical protein